MHGIQRFAIQTAAQCRTAAAGIVDTDEFEAFVPHARPESSFPQTGMTEHDRFIRIDFRNCFQIIHHPGNTPRPCTDGGIFFQPPLCQLFTGIKKVKDAVLPAAHFIAEEIVIGHDRDGIAAPEQIIQRETEILTAARFLFHHLW